MTKILKPNNTKDKHGASNALKAVKQGCSWDVNGCSGSFNDKRVSDPGTYADTSRKTVASSDEVDQHKRLAMGEKI